MTLGVQHISSLKLYTLKTDFIKSPNKINQHINIQLIYFILFSHLVFFVLFVFS